MMEIVTREELWDIGCTFYVNELAGYIAHKNINKAKTFIYLLLFYFLLRICKVYNKNVIGPN